MMLLQQQQAQQMQQQQHVSSQPQLVPPLAHQQQQLPPQTQPQRYAMLNKFSGPVMGSIVKDNPPSVPPPLPLPQPQSQLQPNLTRATPRLMPGAASVGRADDNASMAATAGGLYQRPSALTSRASSAGPTSMTPLHVPPPPPPPSSSFNDTVNASRVSGNITPSLPQNGIMPAVAATQTAPRLMPHPVSTYSTLRGNSSSMVNNNNSFHSNNNNHMSNNASSNNNNGISNRIDSTMVNPYDNQRNSLPPAPPPPLMPGQMSSSHVTPMSAKTPSLLPTQQLTSPTPKQQLQQLSPQQQQYPANMYSSTTANSMMPSQMSMPSSRAGSVPVPVQASMTTSQ
uniref:Uncharacterized protein n=2 Tax=Lygus hesperus TaxID=30085 RepID=A0A0A9X9A1_LYGHE